MSVLNSVQIKYQGKDISPFDVSIASLLLYFFSNDAQLRSSQRHRWQTYVFIIARRGMVIFGWLGLVSLASILLPDSLGPAVYFLYILFSAGELLGHRLSLMFPSWSEALHFPTQELYFSLECNSKRN
ncbi:hypothetical protein ACSBR1_041417 [Camellia fascicularis]